MEERYLSQVAVKEIFPSGQKKIDSSSAAIIGAGGTGSAVAEILTRMGLGSITLVDDDTVESSNLNRQSLYKEEDIGLKKIEVAKRELNLLNAGTKVMTYDERLNFSNAGRILDSTDLIVDGTDNYDARNVINVVSFKLGKPWIFSAVEGTYGYAKAIIPGKTSCLSCFGYPDRGAGVACTVQGVVPTAVRAIASLAASLALKLLIEGDASGDLIYMDVWKPSFEVMEIPKNEDCKVCGRSLSR